MICQFVYLYMEKFSSNLLPTVKNITEGITEWTSKNRFLMLSFFFFSLLLSIYWSSRLEVFLVKGVLKIRSNFTGKHPSRSVISIKLQSNFIEITIWHGCCPVDLLDIFRALYPRDTSGWLLLYLSFFHTLEKCYFGVFLKFFFIAKNILLINKT